ncbi:MAG: 50S ribosomal protein L22 [Chloroflexi bacterium]|nr:50S ribosomal protein L22 [Chloroflexota bacterium]
MEVHAIARNVRMSPRKVRLVGAAIKGKRVSEALSMLRFMPQRASTSVAKALKSASANAENNLDMEPENLYIVRVYADGGRMVKRFRAKARGRAGALHKRSAHITVVVAEKEG